MGGGEEAAVVKRKTRGVSRAVAVGGLDCRDGDMVPAPAEAMRARFRGRGRRSNFKARARASRTRSRRSCPATVVPGHAGQKRTLPLLDASPRDPLFDISFILPELQVLFSYW